MVMSENFGRAMNPEVAAPEGDQPRGGILEGLSRLVDTQSKMNQLRQQMELKDQFDAMSQQREYQNKLAMEAANQAQQQQLDQQRRGAMRDALLQPSSEQDTFDPGTPPAPSPFGGMGVQPGKGPGFAVPGQTQPLNNYVNDFASRASQFSQQKPKTILDRVSDVGSEDELRSKYPNDWLKLYSSRAGQMALDRMPASNPNKEPRTIAAMRLKASDPDLPPEQRARLKAFVDNYDSSKANADVNEIKAKQDAGVALNPADKLRLTNYQKMTADHVSETEKDIKANTDAVKAFHSDLKDARQVVKDYEARTAKGELKNGVKFNYAPYEDILKDDPAGEYGGKAYDPGLWESDANKALKAKLDAAWAKFKPIADAEKAEYDKAQETIRGASDKFKELSDHRNAMDELLKSRLELRDRAKLLKPDQVPEEYADTGNATPAPAGPVAVNSPAEAAKLPSGTLYKTPDGRSFRAP